jgi:hypothetical protein
LILQIYKSSEFAINDQPNILTLPYQFISNFGRYEIKYNNIVITDTVNYFLTDHKNFSTRNLSSQNHTHEAAVKHDSPQKSCASQESDENNASILSITFLTLYIYSFLFNYVAQTLLIEGVSESDTDTYNYI